jgi:hypothetical protein
MPNKEGRGIPSPILLFYLWTHFTYRTNRNAVKTGILKSDKGCLVKTHKPGVFEQGFLLIRRFAHELPDITNRTSNPIRLRGPKTFQIIRLAFNIEGVSRARLDT